MSQRWKRHGIQLYERTKSGYWIWEDDEEVMAGLLRMELPPRLRQCKRICADLVWGRDQTSQITLNRGRREKKEREGKGGNTESLESEGGTYWKFIGFRLCQSFNFLLYCGEREGGRVRGRYPHIRQLCLCFFAQKKKPALGLKVKEGKTCKRSSVSWSFSFSWFPVQGSHFVTQPWSRSLIQSLPLFSFFFLFPLLSPTGRVSQLGLDFLLGRATSLEQPSWKRWRWNGSRGTALSLIGLSVFFHACHARTMTEVRRRERSTWEDVKLLPG